MSFTTTTPCNADNPFVLVHYDLGAATEVLFADVVGLFRTTSGVTFEDMFIQYSTDDVAWTSLGEGFAPGDDSINDNGRRRTGPVTARYWRVAKIGTNNYAGAFFTMDSFNLWETTADLSDSRIVDHAFSVEQDYALLFTDRNARVYKDGVYQADIRTNYESADLPLLNWTQSLDTLITTQPEIPPMRIQRQGADDEWYGETLQFGFIPKYAFTLVITKPAFTLTPSAVTGQVTLTASGASFTAASVDQFVFGNLGGARITEYVSTTVVKAIVIADFFSTAAMASQTWTLETGYEAVWSSTRGWPETCIFYQNRLVLAGGGTLPNLLALSRVAEYYNFDPGFANDDDAIVVILQSDDVPAIHALKADRHLQVFTAAAEYYLEQETNTVVTPRNVAMRRSTSRGIKRGVRPQNRSGSSIFLDRDGSSFREFVFTVDTEGAYISPNLSLLSAHLVDDPVDTAICRATARNQADSFFAVNTDGTLVVAILMSEQEVNGWSLWSTEGEYLRVGVVDGTIYTVVARTIDGAERRYFERFNADRFTDCALTFAAAAGPTLTGLDHLEAADVEARYDGFWETGLAIAGGEVDISEAVTTSGEVGLAFRPTVETLAPWKQGGDGPIVLDGMTRISRVTTSVHETQNLTVQGDVVDFRSFDSNIDDPIPEFTGTKIVDGLLGWRRDNKITLTQDGPAPLTVRAIEYEVQS